MLHRIVVVLIGLCLLQTSVCADEKIVEVTTAKLQTVTKTVRLIGQLKAHRSSVLYAEIDGEIARLQVADGAEVEKGQILTSLVQEELQQQLALAQSSAHLARVHYERLATLQSNEAVSLQAVEDAKSSWLQRDIALNEIKRNLKKTQITAPFVGSIGIFKVSEGAKVKHGDPIVDIYDLSSWLVEFSVPAPLLPFVQIGQKIDVQGNAGRIESLQRVLDPKTQMGTIRARLLTCSQCLLGNTVPVRWESQRQSNVLAIPSQAIFSENNVQYVYVVRENKVFREAVSTGLEGDGLSVIESGLKAADVVVIRNHIRLADKMDVVIAP